MINQSPQGVELAEFPPNVVPRARARNIQWPSEGADLPAVYPLPSSPPTRLVAIRLTCLLMLIDRASQTSQFGSNLYYPGGE